MISRNKFVQICTQAILSTRQRITPINQVSGYRKFHDEVKDNHYMTQMRGYRDAHKSKYANLLLFSKHLTKHTRVGHCQELAEYLSVKIIRALQRYNADATVKVVSSRVKDHVYLRISIQLKHEKTNSTWEVDAWDPRIIDISLSSKGQHKNSKTLIYGTDPKIDHETTANVLPKKGGMQFTFDFPPAKESVLTGNETPAHEVLSKWSFKFPDHSLEDAYKNKLLDEHGKIHHYQRASKWQMKMKKHY